MTFSRRDFVGGAGASLAAFSAIGISPRAASAQLIDQRADWNYSEFNKLISTTARARQVYDVRAVGEGKFLNNVKNSLNGFRYGFGIPDNQIKVVVALHGPSNALAFDDSMWQKYRLGEFVQVDDPSTGKPATRNIFFPKKINASTSLQAPNSHMQDHSIQTLQERGVKFLCCHTAAEEQAGAMIKKFSLKTSADEIVKDLQAHVLPGVLVVPAMVATVALLQSEGHFTYITV